MCTSTVTWSSDELPFRAILGMMILDLPALGPDCVLPWVLCDLVYNLCSPPISVDISDTMSSTGVVSVVWLGLPPLGTGFSSWGLWNFARHDLLLQFWKETLMKDLLATFSSFIAVVRFLPQRWGQSLSLMWGLWILLPAYGMLLYFPLWCVYCSSLAFSLDCLEDFMNSKACENPLKPM